MRQYSPTSLNTFIENCGAALGFYWEEKLQREYEIEGPEMAEIGIVFHACCHQCALARAEERNPFDAMQATALALTKAIAPDRVRAGHEHALEFVRWWEFPAKFNFEHGVAFDEKWRPVAWDAPDRKLRLIFDAVGTMRMDDENEGEMTIAVGQDYKSGWGVSDKELHSIQMDAYLSSMRRMYPDVDGYKIEIVSTRFKRIWHKLYLVSQEEDLIELRLREERLKFYLQAADISDLSARTGSGCMQCNFTGRCDAFRQHFERVKANTPTDGSPLDLAKDLAVAETRVKELETILKRMIAGRKEPLEVGEKLLGFHATEKRIITDPTALLGIIKRAYPDLEITLDIENMIRGMLVSLDPGVGAVESVVGDLAKQLGHKYKKDAVEAELEKIAKPQAGSKFGWQKKPKTGGKVA